MIHSVKEHNVTIVCPFCKYATTYDLSEVEVPFNKELGEYPLIEFECGCGAKNCINLNIPVSDEEEELNSSKISTDLEVARFYVRLLQRMVRPDMRRGGKKK